MELKKDLVLSDTDKVLREKSIDLDINNISEQEQYLIDQMQLYIDTCYRNEASQAGIRDGIAIASNQVGLLKKVIYVHLDIDKKEYKYLLANPKIVAYSKGKIALSSGEACLSVNDDHEGYVPRYARIIVQAYDLLNKKDITIDANGLLAICLQHEIDHLSGILYYDHINKDDPMYKDKDLLLI